jgi:transcriptional regulator with XRE-family HTH domain
MSIKSKYFCEQLRRLRGDRSQAEIANNIGLSQQNYSRYESGFVMPKHDALHKIAKYFCVSIDDLLTSGVHPETPPAPPSSPCRYPEACDLEREFSQVRDELTSVDARLSAMTAQLETVTRLLGAALGNGLSHPKEQRHRAAG